MSENATAVMSSPTCALMTEGAKLYLRVREVVCLQVGWDVFGAVSKMFETSKTQKLRIEKNNVRIHRKAS